jgi:L-ascorbate oxidase
MLFKAAALALLALTSARATCVPTIEHTLIIENDLGSPIVNAGPLLERVLIRANGTIPGPEIRVKVHDCVKVNIINKLTLEGVSIHYHGIRQTGSPWNDGTALVSECPIVPGASRAHVFKVENSGTFWWHR